MRAFSCCLVGLLAFLCGCNRYEVVSQTYEVPKSRGLYLGKDPTEKVMHTRTIRVDKYSGKSWTLYGDKWHPNSRERSWTEWMSGN